MTGSIPGKALKCGTHGARSMQSQPRSTQRDPVGNCAISANATVNRLLVFFRVPRGSYAFWVVLAALLATGLLSSADAHASAQGLTLLQTAPAPGGQSYSIPADSLPYVLLLPFLPALLLSLSAFTRVAVVFFLLRQGLGNQYAPPNLVLIGLAMLLTYFIMQPVVHGDEAAWPARLRLRLVLDGRQGDVDIVWNSAHARAWARRAIKEKA